MINYSLNMSLITKNILNQVLNDSDFVNEILSQNLLLVGCGGIGCEVIKNLLLIGFNKITLIDIDSIDVSNLNRQFLFNKTHINQSKAIISAKVATNLFAHHQEVDIKPICDSILNQEFDVDFFKSFTLVINALDNRQARSHVNRMCLVANVPLIESGTEGYIGQTFVIKKNVSSCYDCEGPKQDQKTFASCTIRNTPSLPIHCVVWAKHLFAQLFGEADADNDVSPDINDPELNSINDKENISRSKQPISSTRKWAEFNQYDPVLLFDKLFKLDIEYLHKMKDLWKNRNKPIILRYEDINKGLPTSSNNTNEEKNLNNSTMLKDQKLLTLKDCYDLFVKSVSELKDRFDPNNWLIWDKDDEACLDFVTAVSNLRSYCFHIERKSKFDIKSMAGNIIPAISSTNSIIGGLIVLQVLNLLRKLCKLKKDERNDKKKIDLTYKNTIKQIFLKKVSPNVGNLISSYNCFEPNEKCMVCSTKNIPEIDLSLNFQQTTMSMFVDQFIKKKLHFIYPEIQLDGQPTIIYSEESGIFIDEQIEVFKTKTLDNYSYIKDKIRLNIYDLVQTLTVVINLKNENFNSNENDGQFYKMNILTTDSFTENNNNSNSDSKEASNGTKDELNKNDDSIEVDNFSIEIVSENIQNNHLDKKKIKNNIDDIEIVNLENEDENSVTNVIIHDEESCEIICDNDQDIQVVHVKDKRKYVELDDKDELDKNIKKIKV